MANEIAENNQSLITYAVLSGVVLLVTLFLSWNRNGRSVGAYTTFWFWIGLLILLAGWALMVWGAWLADSKAVTEEQRSFIRTVWLLMLTTNFIWVILFYGLGAYETAYYIAALAIALGVGLILQYSLIDINAAWLLFLFFLLLIFAFTWTGAQRRVMLE